MLGRVGDASREHLAELHVAQVPGIAAFGEQPFEHFGIADIPAYAGFVGREQSHDGVAQLP